MQKLGMDVHALAGASGFFASAILGRFNEIASVAVGVATAVYMGLRAYREWKKIKKEK